MGIIAKPKKFIFVVSLLISVIFIFLLVELSLRLFKPVYFCNTVSQFQYDEKLGFVTRPNFKINILTDHIIEVYTNDIGSRNFLNKNELLQYKKVVFCVGDSFTEGVGNLSDQSYPFYLDLLLNKTSDSYKKEIAVFNLGIGGYGSIQAYLISKKFIEKTGVTPNAIIYFISSSDFEDDALFASGYRFHHLVSGSPYFPYFLVNLNNVFEYSQIYSRIKIFVATVLKKSYLHKLYSLRKKESLDRVTSNQLSPDRLTGLINLINFSKKNNINLIISYADYANGEYGLFKKFAAENNIYFVDYKSDIESVIKVFLNLPAYNQHSGGHFRSWVNFIIASKFAELIKNVI